MLDSFNKKPTISVIVPVHNATATLNKCVESIVNQSYKMLEIILINNGSKDNSLELCKNWSDKDARIKVLDLPIGNVSSARNAGLDIVSGEFFTFVDSDDYVDKAMYEKLYKVAAKEKSDAVYCKFFNVRADSCTPSNEEGLYDFVHGRAEYLFANDKKYIHPCVWRVLYNTKKYGDLRFDERLFSNEDTVYYIECLKFNDCKLSLVDEPLYYYAISNYGRKYTNKQYAENIKILIQSATDFLMHKGLSELAQAYCFFQYKMLIICILKYMDDGITEIKHLLKDDFWKSISSKGNYLACKKQYSQKYEGIKNYLILHKMFKTLKFLLTLKNHK